MVDVSSGEIVEFDSNFLISALQAGGVASEALHGWIRIGARVQLSAIAWSEYLCGPLDVAVVPFARRLVAHVEPFTEQDADLASDLFNQTGRRPRSHVDCMIAAHAIRRGAALATLNMADFRRFKPFGLKLL